MFTYRFATCKVFHKISASYSILILLSSSSYIICAEPGVSFICSRFFMRWVCVTFNLNKWLPFLFHLFQEINSHKMEAFYKKII